MTRAQLKPNVSSNICPAGLTGPASPTACSILLKSIESLQKKKAEVVVLGCTEIPIGVPERKIGDTFIIDPGVILARALIRETAQEKLVPWYWDL